MPRVGEDRDRHFGDVVRIDERLAAIPGGQPQLAGNHRRLEKVLAEVLMQPAQPEAGEP